MRTLLNNTYILDKKRESRVMRLYVLSSGYVAVVTHADDLEFWGSPVIPLGFGSEVSAQEAVERIQRGNPLHLVSFAGGMREYKARSAKGSEVFLP